MIHDKAFFLIVVIYADEFLFYAYRLLYYHNKFVYFGSF